MVVKTRDARAIPTTVGLPADVENAVTQLAFAERTSRSAVVVRLLRQALTEQRERETKEKRP